MIVTGAEKKSKKIIFQHTTETVDRETGEITKETAESTSRFNAEPPYIKMYIDDLCAVVNAPNAVKDLLLLILRKLDYDGYITLSTRYRKQLCAELEIKDGTLRNRLSALVKRGFIFSEGGNEYIANPNLFARGDWRQIVEQRASFQMKIRYSAEGKREIQTEFIPEEAAI